MKRKFVIYGIKPISVNATLIPNHRGFTKSVAAQEFSYQLFHQLNSDLNQRSLEELRNAFVPGQHGYGISIETKYPRSKFYTKKGGVSAVTVDVSNFEKPIVDILFLPKHFDCEPPYGVKNLNMDDKFLITII